MSDGQNQRLRPKQPQEHEYYYYKDTEGRMKRVRKLKYQTRPGYIRLKFLEKLYIKYIRSSYDSKLTYQPWIVGLAIVFFIYQTTMLWSQNDLNREIKARLPFEFKNQQVTEVYRLLRESKKQDNAEKRENRESRTEHPRNRDLV